MLRKYHFSSQGAKEEPTQRLQDSNLVLLSRASQRELEQVCRTFDLDPLTFAYHSSPEEVSRYHKITSQFLPDAHLLVVYDFIEEATKIEEQLTPVIMIFNRDHLIICTNNAGPDQELIGRENNIIEFVAAYVLQCQNKLMATLTSYKPIIDWLDAAAQNSFGNNELRQLT